LIGFIDDYSRYVVGLELYRSQTADQVLEVYRRAVGEYGVAKEVLTDRGRQYTTWRDQPGLSGVRKGPGEAHQIAGPSSDDIGQDRAVLEDDL